jgi:hypothetical protein
VKSTLLGLLRENDDWKTPIVINAQYPQANLPEIPSAELNVSQTGAGLKLQLDLTIAADINGPAIERELLRVVLIEMIYRDAQNLPAGTRYVQPADWLLEGVLACDSQSDPTGFAELLKGFVAANKVISLEEFLRQRPELLDSPSCALHRAYSFALVTLLKDSPECRRLFAKFIADLPEAPNDVAADLRAHFPMLGDSRESAERIWQLSVARVSDLERYKALTVAETEHQLDDLLRLRFPDASRQTKTWRLEDYREFLHMPDRTAALNRLREDLMLLGPRVNSLYRPMVLEYQQIISSLARGKTRGITRRIARLKNSRQALAERMREIDDYMNWFEATQARTHSGTFVEYLKAADQPAETGSRRHDPISIYIDAMESQFRD